METGTLTGTHHFPDDTPKTGTVNITPVPSVIRDEAGNVVLSGSVSVALDETGSFSVVLAATDDATLDPTGFTYTVSGHGPLRGIPVVRGIAIPAGETVDMADLISVDPDAPSYAPWVYGTGSGTITSVNGDAGPVVVLDAADVGARPCRFSGGRSGCCGHRRHVQGDRRGDRTRHRRRGHQGGRLRR